MTAAPWPGPDAPPDWYRSPSGELQRWWTGTAWGLDVALPEAHPDPPPEWRRNLPGPDPAEAVTTVLVIPPTPPAGWAIPRHLAHPEEGSS